MTRSIVAKLWTNADGRQRVATLVALAAFVAAFAIQPLGQRLSPRLAVAIAAASPGSGGFNKLPDGTYKGRVEAKDPWGHSLVALTPAMTAPCTYYSVGPNGEDEDGKGDDVVPSAADLRLGARLQASASGLFCLGILVLWCAFSRFARAPRSESLATELGQSLTLAVLPMLLLPGLVAGLILGRRDVTECVNGLGRAFPTPVHPLVSIGLGDVALCFMVALAWRLSRPRANEGDGV